MKANEILNNFGEEFISEVRDSTIENMEMILSGKMKSEEARKLFQKVKDLDEETQSIVREFIFKTIDNGLFNTLTFFEQSEEYAIQYQDEDNTENLNDLSDGLAGELYSDNGWITKYSKYKE